MRLLIVPSCQEFGKGFWIVYYPYPYIDGVVLVKLLFPPILKTTGGEPLIFFGY